MRTSGHHSRRITSRASCPPPGLACTPATWCRDDAAVVPAKAISPSRRAMVMKNSSPFSSGSMPPTRRVTSLLVKSGVNTENPAKPISPRRIGSGESMRKVRPQASTVLCNGSILNQRAASIFPVLASSEVYIVQVLTPPGGLPIRQRPLMFCGSRPAELAGPQVQS